MARPLYPVDTMSKLGFDAPPKNLDEFLAFGEKAKAGGMMATMLPAAAGEVTALHMLSMFWGLGGEMVDATGKPVFFDGANRVALEKVYGLYQAVDNARDAIMTEYDRPSKR